MKQEYGFYIDVSRCTGCKTCQLACKDYKDLPADINFRRVYEFTGGGWQKTDDGWANDVFAYYLSISCNHCSDPICVSICPTGAMYKQEDNGLVSVNEDVCIGCQSCEMACPYGSPQYDERKGIMTKCNGCAERVSLGLQPVCVESCPLRALDFGPIDELRSKYGGQASIAPLPAATLTNPNLTITPGRTARATDDHSGLLGNPKEV